jgi:hypothetical protein
MTPQVDRYYCRHPLATAVTGRAQVLFILPGEKSRPCTDVDSASVSELWAALAIPISEADLRARMDGCPPALEKLFGNLLDSPFVISGTSDRIPFATPEPAQRGRSNTCRRLVLGVTGAVQAALLPQDTGRLLEFAERVDVVLTRAARRFVRPRALSALGLEVWGDPFDARVPVPHIHLAAAADLVLVMPATANAIFRLAHGTCSDLLSLVVAATRAPTVIVPSMNETMWHHPATQRNVELLRGYGMYLVEPGPGSSIANGASHQLGGAGFGLSNANLVSTLEAVLRVSK